MLKKAGCRRNIFDSSTVELIYEQSHGEPRSINRFCELSLLATMGEGHETVSADVVIEELQAQLPSNEPLLA